MFKREENNEHDGFRGSMTLVDNRAKGERDALGCVRCEALN